MLATRTKAGVLAFGTDANMRSAFDPYGITDFDLHTIETKRLRYDSGERGLLRSALTQAITRQLGLMAIRRGTTDLLAPSDPGCDLWAELKQHAGTLAGTVVGNSELRWREGVGIRLDWADERLRVLIEPRTVSRASTTKTGGGAADFSRSAMVKRYNRQLNALIAFSAKRIQRRGRAARFRDRRRSRCGVRLSGETASEESSRMGSEIPPCLPKGPQTGLRSRSAFGSRHPSPQWADPFGPYPAAWCPIRSVRYYSSCQSREVGCSMKWNSRLQLDRRGYSTERIGYRHQLAAGIWPQNGSAH